MYSYEKLKYAKLNLSYKMCLHWFSVAWLAVRQLFPNLTIKGCVFHFVQAVCREIQDLGLKPAYSQHASV
jgi:hypothetical protein